MKRNKMIALGLSAVMALSLAACGNVNDSKLQPPNPFAEYETLADMEKEPPERLCDSLMSGGLRQQRLVLPWCWLER